MTGPVSTPASTKWTVQPVTFDAVRERVAHAWAPGNDGQQRGVGVDDGRRTRRGTPGPRIFMKPALTTRSGS